MLEVPPTPDHILAILQSYRDAAALNTAIELDLFTRIARGADSAAKLAKELDVPARGVRLLCDYLATAGLLSEDHEQLTLAPDAAAFLDKESIDYLAPDLRALYSPALLHAFEQLTETVRAGAARAASPARPEWFDLARGVHSPKAAPEAFANSLNLPDGPVKILELGAAQGTHPGAFGIALARRYPKAVVVALDSAPGLAKAQKNAEAAQLGTRYQNIAGDPLTADLGLEYDAIVIPGALYHFDDAQITSLFMRLRYALKKTGRLVILDVISDGSGEFNRRYSGFRLNVLATTSRGDAFSITDFEALLANAGFHNVETRPLPEAAATVLTAMP
jgi:hypothetical protein